MFRDSYDVLTAVKIKRDDEYEPFAKNVAQIPISTTHCGSFFFSSSTPAGVTLLRQT